MAIANDLPVFAEVYLDEEDFKSDNHDKLPSDDVLVFARKQFEKDSLAFMQEHFEYLKDVDQVTLTLKMNWRM